MIKIIVAVLAFVLGFLLGRVGPGGDSTAVFVFATVLVPLAVLLYNGYRIWSGKEDFTAYVTAIAFGAFMGVFYGQIMLASIFEHWIPMTLLSLHVLTLISVGWPARKLR